MKLSFLRRHASIASLPDICLPKLTVVTGLNGSGKSHLFQALQSKALQCDVAPNPETDIRYFDWATIAVSDSQTVDSASQVQFRQQYIQLFERYIKLSLDLLEKECGHLTLPTGMECESQQLLKFAYGLDNRGDEWDALRVSFRQVADAVLSNLKSQLNSHVFKDEPVENAARKHNLPILLLRSSHLFGDLPTYWGEAHPFRQTLAQVFVAYRDAKIENRLKKIALDEGDPSVHPLSASEFDARFNRPPWIFVNEVLRDAEIDFEIDKPSEHTFLPYAPRLTKISSRAEVHFPNLSTGEKVIIALAIAMYHANDGRQIVPYPKLLLLDEIDAPLHPSMCKYMLRVIQDVLISKYGVHVMLATHSATTVALAPEDSIYVMESCKPGLQKQSKNKAISILTQGVPTLSLTYEGRRQVFVESDTDASVYSRLFQVLKTDLDTELSLEFIGIGVRTAQGDRGSGCSQVRQIVKKLVDSGCRSIVGLVDWDGKVGPSSHVLVAAHEQRDGLENCIFDPLILVLQVARDLEKVRAKIGLRRETTFLQVSRLERDELQRLVADVCNFLGTSGEELISVTYANGLELSVPKSHLHMDDHALEQRVLEKFPEFNEVARKNKLGLMDYIASTTMTELPEFIPEVLKDTLKQLLEIAL